jgi:putative acetyltransferase
MTLFLERVTAPNDDVRSLIAELDAFLHAPGHDPKQHHGYAIEKIFNPAMRFIVARVRGEAVGCGGVEIQGAAGELKRMYTRPAFRGTGVSRAIIARLEDEARAEGCAVVRLETGDWIDRARGFYTREGYSECGAFPPYTELPAFNIAHSVFMEKRI